MKFGYIENNVGLDDLTLTFPEDNPLTKNVLNSKKSNNLSVYIGCPVWSQKGYVGKIYPPKTPAKNYLKEYCKQFNSIEVNATRYRIPNISDIEKWKSVAPDNFKFSLKFSEIISHRKDIGDSSNYSFIDEFVTSAYQLGDNLGICFLQLPPYFSPERVGQLEKFLNHLPDDFELAVELRNKDWFSQEGLQIAYDVFNSKNTSFLITDALGRRDVLHQTMTNKTLMVRFVGQMLHETDYLRIDQWIDKIEDWASKGLEKVYFFMHQPEPYKYLSADIASYMIQKLNTRFPEIKLKAPIDYSLDVQKGLF